MILNLVRLKYVTTEQNKRLFTNFISLFLIQATNYILPLITFPYLISRLGFAKFGMISFASAVIYYMQVFVDYGFNLSATRDISKHRKNDNYISTVFSAVLTIKVALSLICFLVLVVFTRFIDTFSKEPDIFFFSFGMTISGALFPLWLFQGFEEMKYISRINITMKCLATAMIFILINKEQDYLKVPIIYSICFILASVIALIIGMKRFKIQYCIPTVADIKHQLKNSFHIFIAGFSGNLYGQGTVVILGLVSTPQIVGFYATAEKIIKALSGLMQPVSQALYPYISHMDAEDLGRFYGKSQKITYLFSLAASLLLFIFSKDLLRLFFHTQQIEIVNSLKLLSIALFFTYMNVYLNIFLLTLRFDSLLSKLYLLVGLSFLLFSYLLSSFYSLYGTCISLLLVEVTIFLFSIYCLRTIQSGFLRHPYAKI